MDTISFALEKSQLWIALHSPHRNAPGDPLSLLLLSADERETRLGDEGARHIMKEGYGACEFSSGNHQIRNGPTPENQRSWVFPVKSWLWQPHEAWLPSPAQNAKQRDVTQQKPSIVHGEEGWIRGPGTPKVYLWDT